MALQKREAREGADAALDILQKIYGMEGTKLAPADVQAFRDRTRLLYEKWVEEIGPDLVSATELAIRSVK